MQLTTRMPVCAIANTALSPGSKITDTVYADKTAGGHEIPEE